MRYVKLKSLPKIRFAHAYGAATYENELPVKKGQMEICYIAEGINHAKQGGVLYVEEKYDIACNLFEDITYIKTKGFHEHHSVSFSVEFEILEEDAEGAICLPRHLRCGGRKKIHDLVDEIISAFSLTPQRSAKLSGLFLETLSEFDELARRQTEEKNGASSRYVRRAKAYVYENLRRPITQREVAEYLNITPEYLCAAFKKEGEDSLIQFINKVKLSQMRTVMKRENLKLYEAAEMFGYADPNYVSRLYKKLFGQNVTD